MSVEPIPNGAGSERARRGPRRTVLVAGVVLGVLVAGVLSLNVLEPERHADGHGPLSSLADGTVIGMAAPIADGESVTFGLELCLTDGSTALVESVGPHLAVGSGAMLVGSLIRHRDLTQMHGDMIGSVPGFPPKGYEGEPWADAVGAAVSHRCEREHPTAYTELIVGLRAVGATSGGWHGVEVGYRSGWRHRVLVVQYDLFLCRPIEPNCDEELLQ
jgi:hypothetical protein